jgi:hypothetical protein
VRIPSAAILFRELFGEQKCSLLAGKYDKLESYPVKGNHWASQCSYHLKKIIHITGVPFKIISL